MHRTLSTSQPVCSIAPSTLPRSRNFSRRNPSECSTSTIASTGSSSRPSVEASSSTQLPRTPWADRDVYITIKERSSRFSIELSENQQCTTGYQEDEHAEDDGYAGDDDSSVGSWDSDELLNSRPKRRNAFEGVRESLEGLEFSQSERMNDLRRKMRNWQASNWVQKGKIVGRPKLVWIRSSSSSSITSAGSL